MDSIKLSCWRSPA